MPDLADNIQHGPTILAVIQEHGGRIKLQDLMSGLDRRCAGATPSTYVVRAALNALGRQYLDKPERGVWAIRSGVLTGAKTMPFATLDQLAELLSVADSPSRELDCLTALLCEGYFEIPPRFEGDALGYGYERDGQRHLPGHGGAQLVPKYTASLDAAMKFRERVCPSVVLRVCFTSTGLVQVHEAWDAAANDGDLKIVLFGSAKVGGISIVHAVVKALIARAAATKVGRA